MSTIPKVIITSSKVSKATLNYTGDMCNAYSPLLNLVDTDTKILKDFTTEKLNFDLEHPVDILVQDSYDGSVNLILNDDKNVPRLVNSRFSIQENNKFLIPEHRGYKDTNIYDEGTFNIDTALKPIPIKIPHVVYDGLFENQGNLLCGAYTFYFKLSDADGNESEVIAESGIVQIHMGAPNTPSEIRMGLENENTKKAVQFTLDNIDSGFDYIHVLYARSSSGADLATADSYYKIIYNYPIRLGKCIINITGNETKINVELELLYVNYADLQSVKTLTEVANVLMFGNVSKPYHDYDALQQIAWRIIPYQITNEKGFVGHINTEYLNSVHSSLDDTTLCYYNTKNVYYRLGYWPDEIYRFGIVYIFDDNSLSPVFNIQGVDFNAEDSIHKSDYEQAFFQNGDIAWECDTEDHFFNKLLLGKDISKWKLNSKGVIKFKDTSTIGNSNDGILIPTPIGIKFDFSRVNLTKFNKPGEDVFAKHNIKGFFFVRLKRIPTILGLGVAIGVTDREYGSIPVIKNPFGDFIAESFLNNERLLQLTGSLITIPKKNVKIKGLLVPDAEICEGVYNDIFVGNEFCLKLNGKYSFNQELDKYHLRFKSYAKYSNISYISALLNIPEDIHILSNGTDYFSTIAGNPHEAYKTIDVKNSWRYTVPLDLTVSTSLVRGLFGSFVGLSSPTHDDEFPFEFGEVYNIKDKRYAEDEETATILDFIRRFEDYSEYKAVCDRTEVTDTVTCYRGDCFLSMFTHRMSRNFIDPELPTNTEIVDPSCWAANYAVRCTAAITTTAHSNLVDDSDGWEIPAPLNLPWVQALIYFLTGNIFGAIKTLIEGYQPPSMNPEDYGLEYDYIEEGGKYYKKIVVLDANGNPELDKDHKIKYKKGAEFDPKKDLYPNGYANEIVQAFEVYKGRDNRGSYLRETLKKKKVNPSQLESAGAFDFKAMFKSDDNWDLRGLASINRADVNAVGLGQWVTFPILSSRNLAFRDIDYSNSIELASFNKKRSFYPLQKLLKLNPLRDSHIINAATSISIPHKPYFGITDYRFLKQEFFTRVFNSVTDSANSFTNEYKHILESSHLDYTKKYGSLTKLIAVNNIVYAIFEHGIGYVTFLPTLAGVSPEMMQDAIMLTDTFGSIWKDSIIEANGVVYGVDSVAKKIWYIAENSFKVLSDFKVLKFLIDNLDMSEFTTQPYIGHINIKTHFNAYKNDIIFTYYNDKPIYTDGVITGWEPGLSWSLCYNQVLDKFITFYDWYPVESSNIDNIYFSFDKERFNELTSNDYKPKINKVSIDTENKYITKKFNIDSAFTHNIIVYKPEELVIFSIAEDLLDSIVSFYFKGNLTIKGIGLNNELEILHSEEWQHITLYVSKCTSDSVLLLEGDYEITEIFTCSASLFLEIEEHASKFKNINHFIYPEENISPLLKYNLHNTQDLMFLWKHGQAGIYDIQGKIKPTNWYNKQHEFSFEFIVNESSEILKIFNNLKIVSNKTEPYKFEYEIVGEGYEWFEYKKVIKWINDRAKVSSAVKDWYKKVLSTSYGDLLKEYSDFPGLFNKEDSFVISLLPYINILEAQELQVIDSTHDNEYKHNSAKTTLVYDKRQNDFNIRTELYGNDIKKYGRVKGDMHYLEDLWDIEIRPIAFTYAYLNAKLELVFKTLKETRHRDKYIKIKVRYSGKDLAVIQAIYTLFEYSYA